MFYYRGFIITLSVVASLTLMSCTCKMKITMPPEDGLSPSGNILRASIVTTSVNCSNCVLDSFSATIDGSDQTALFTCAGDACTASSAGLPAGTHVLAIDAMLDDDHYLCNSGRSTDQRSFVIP